VDPAILLIWLAIGAIAGWLAGMIVDGGGFGLIGNIVIGIVGAIIAGALLPAIGIVMSAGVVGAIISAAIGACVLLIAVRIARR